MIIINSPLFYFLKILSVYSIDFFAPFSPSPHYTLKTHHSSP